MKDQFLDLTPAQRIKVLQELGFRAHLDSEGRLIDERGQVAQVPPGRVSDWEVYGDLVDQMTEGLTDDSRTRPQMMWPETGEGRVSPDEEAIKDFFASEDFFFEDDLEE